MVGWRHWCNGHELGQTLGDAEGQGGLAAVHWVAESRTWLGNRTTFTPIECTTPRVNPKENWKLWEIMMNQCRFTDFSKCITLKWRSKWQPTPVFLPRRFHEQRCLEGHRLWCHKSQTNHHHHHSGKDADNEGGNEWVIGAKHTWETSVLSPQFCYVQIFVKK